MAKKAFIMTGSDKHKVTNIYIKANNTRHKVVAGYIVVGGARKQFWPSVTPPTPETYYYLKANTRNTQSYSGTTLREPAVVNEDTVHAVNDGYVNRRAFLYGGGSDGDRDSTVRIIDSGGAITTKSTSYQCTAYYSGAWYNNWTTNNEKHGACFVARNTMFTIDKTGNTETYIGSISDVDSAASARHWISTNRYDSYAYFSTSLSSTVNYFNGFTLQSILNVTRENRSGKVMCGWNFNTSYEESPWTGSKAWYGILIAGGQNSKQVDVISISGTVFHLADLPYTLTRHAMANVGNYILLAGGLEGSAQTNAVYTFIGNGYTRGTTTPLSYARAGLKGGTLGNDWAGSISVFTNNAIFAGGTTSSGTSSAVDGYFMKRANKADQGHIEKIANADIPQLSAPRRYHAAFNVTNANGKDFLVFGFGADGTSTNYQNGEYYTSVHGTSKYVSETLYN